MKLSVFGTRTDTHTSQKLYIVALLTVIITAVEDYSGVDDGVVDYYAVVKAPRCRSSMSKSGERH